MAHHIFRNEYRSMNLPVMNTESVSDEFWDNRAGSRPCLDDGFFSGFDKSFNFLNQSSIDIRSFFKTTCHIKEITNYKLYSVIASETGYGVTISVINP